MADVVCANFRAKIQSNQVWDAATPKINIFNVAPYESALDNFHGRRRQRLPEHILSLRCPTSRGNAAQVYLMGYSSRPRKKFSFPKKRREHGDVVLVYPSADPWVIAKKHVALMNSGICT